MTVHATPGRHVLADFHGVAAAGLSDAAALERQLLALTDVAEALLEHDTLTRTEFEAVMRGEKLPPEAVKPTQPSESDESEDAPETEKRASAFRTPAAPPVLDDDEPFIEP